MQNILTFSELIVTSYMLVSLLSLKGTKDYLLAFWGIAIFLITSWGYILSALGYLGTPTAWSCIGFISLAVIGIIAYKKILPFHFQKFSLNRWELQKFSFYTPFTKSILILLFLFSALVNIANFYLIFSVTPHNWDSMTTHLPRMAQYIHQGNLKEFNSNNWAQITQAKGSTVLFIYIFLISGLNENLTQIAQYISLLIVALAVYGISRKLGWERAESYFASMISLLIVSNVTQASTNLNDLIIASHFGLAIYFLFCFRETHSYKYLALSSLGLGLAIGTKASSFSVLPSYLLILLLTTWKNGGGG